MDCVCMCVSFCDFPTSFVLVFFVLLWLASSLTLIFRRRRDDDAVGCGSVQ